MKQRVQACLRFLPLVAYAAGLVYMMIYHRSFESVWTVVLLTMPVALGIPLSVVFIGAKKRRRRTYILGAVASAAGVVAVIALAALFALMWISMGLSNNEEANVEIGEVIVAFILLFATGTEVLWMLTWGSMAATVWMTVKAIFAEQQILPEPVNEEE